MLRKVNGWGLSSLIPLQRECPGPSVALLVLPDGHQRTIRLKFRQVRSFYRRYKYPRTAKSHAANRKLNFFLIFKYLKNFCAGRRRSIPVRLRPSGMDDREMDRFFRGRFRSVHQVNFQNVLLKIKCHRFCFFFFYSLIGTMFPLPRILYAMSCDGLLFGMFSDIHPRFQTPLLATLLSGLLAGKEHR